MQLLKTDYYMRTGQLAKIYYYTSAWHDLGLVCNRSLYLM